MRITVFNINEGVYAKSNYYAKIFSIFIRSGFNATTAAAKSPSNSTFGSIKANYNLISSSFPAGYI
jgi:hypothetical protein